MKFKGLFIALDVDIDRYISGLHQHLDDEMRAFLRQWLTTATGRIPLYSGLTRGSFQAVAKLVGERIVLSPLKAKSRAPQGEALGTAALDGKTPGLVKFSFESSARAITFLDASRGKSPSSPWGSLDAGSAAFSEFSKKVELPEPKLFRRPIQVG